MMDTAGNPVLTPSSYCAACGRPTDTGGNCHSEHRALFSKPRITPEQRLALEQAASGHVSGTLSEWPVLADAFRAVGVDVGPTAPLSALRTLAKAALQALDKQGA